MFIYLDFVQNNFFFSFQNPASIYMFLMIKFHQYINFILIFIILFVLIELLYLLYINKQIYYITLSKYLITDFFDFLNQNILLSKFFSTFFKMSYFWNNQKNQINYVKFFYHNLINGSNGSKFTNFSFLKIPTVNWAKDIELEQIWTIIPANILALLAIPSFFLLYSTSFVKFYDVNLKIIGNQWFWTYEYGMKYFTYSTFCPIESDTFNFSQEFWSFDSYMIDLTNLNVGSLNLLEVDCTVILPIKKWIHFLVTSRDVIHSWAIPSFALKLDACPGRLIETCQWLNRLGFFFGQCSEICGINHAFMPIVVFTTYLFNFYDLLLENYYCFFTAKTEGLNNLA